MTDRHAGYLVVLAEDLRADSDAEYVLNAIRMIKGVQAVTPVPASYELAIAQERRDDQWHDVLYRLSRLARRGGLETFLAALPARD
jgi:hypothetical protein